MNAPISPAASALRLPRGPDAEGTLTERLEALHDSILERVPHVDRVACALYDAPEDSLRTFVNSTRHGEAIAGYQFPLAESPSLQALATSGEFRVIDELADAVHPTSPHSSWLLAQGYRSSFTVPMYDNDSLLGFVFFNSLQPAAFSLRDQRDLLLFCNLINMAIANEMSAVRAILASARIARDFAKLRDFETGAHLERMARYARLIARALARAHGRTDEFVEHVYLFAPLHDIGKIGIPDAVLLKQGRLEDAERAAMQRHVDLGGSIIDKILGDLGLRHLPDSTIMKNIVRHHHEMLDGSGYPEGLRGDAIALEARIVTVADIFDALMSPRPYKPAWTFDASCAELARLAALGKLDPECVAALRQNEDAVRAILARYQDRADV
ncbi:MAG: HD domain-containing protein [Rhodoferax sp.]|nr:HD domain-containing protein [Rhodoferax sp.]